MSNGGTPQAGDYGKMADGLDREAGRLDDRGRDDGPLIRRRLRARAERLRAREGEAHG